MTTRLSSSTPELPRGPANHMALTPLGFIQWSASVYPDRAALVHGAFTQSWAQTYRRCRRLASALRGWRIGVGDTVAVMAPNTPALYEAHFGVPMAGAQLNAINTRLDAATVAYILNHAQARVFIVDREYAGLAASAMKNVDHPVRLVRIDDTEYDGPPDDFGECDYEQFLNLGADEDWAWPADEWQSICVNYTSGTTGNPKGVVYHHRGAYLNAVGNVLAAGLRPGLAYLWTLPMFHCNGWCFPWTVASLAGTNVCLRRVDAAAVFQAMRQHRIDLFCAAPIVLNMLINAPADIQYRVDHPITAITGGAAPAASVIAAMESLGVSVSHLYGLTETYGPSIVCAWHDDWDAKPLAERAALKARIGVRKLNVEHVRVVDDALDDVRADGETMGEIVIRGNTVMKGYLHDPGATEQAFAGGWFHTGDLGVMHADGYIQIKDRAKDIIISGGENISTVEVESVIYRHPAVLEAAVVARPDEKWGETPCAFIELREGKTVSSAEIIEFCREHLAHFKAPRTVIFGPLPKTSTGKIQKFVLRDQTRKL